MASYYLSPIGNNTQSATSGAPLNAGTITTYQAGTTTPQTTYTDNTGATPQANPITLNTYGLPSSPIWLKGGQSYKFLIKDSLGNTVRTIDTVTGINDSVFSGSDGTAQYVSAIAGTNTITGTSAGLVAYTAGQVFSFLPAAANTGAVTLNINSLGAKNVYRGGVVIGAGALASGLPVEVMYDGTQFQIISAPNPWAVFTAVANANQSITDSVATKVTLATISRNVNNNFASSRFTATVAGDHQFNGVVRCVATNGTIFYASLYKNGVENTRGAQMTMTANSNFQQMPVSDTIYLDVGDFVELYGFVAGTAPSFNFNAIGSACRLSGFLARPA